MKKTFKTIKADAGKLNVQFEHEYHPLKDDQTVTLTVEHFHSMEAMGYVNPDTHALDFKRIFLDKVKAVSGITIVDADGNEVPATKEDIINIYDPDFLMIVMNTGNHLMAGMSFTEEEAKN